MIQDIVILFATSFLAFSLGVLYSVIREDMRDTKREKQAAEAQAQERAMENVFDQKIGRRDRDINTLRESLADCRDILINHINNPATVAHPRGPGRRKAKP